MAIVIRVDDDWSEFNTGLTIAVEPIARVVAAVD
jgi:hypothetical protein